jgi:hypothetical protein
MLFGTPTRHLRFRRISRADRQAALENVTLELEEVKNTRPQRKVRPLISTLWVAVCHCVLSVLRDDMEYVSAKWTLPAHHFKVCRLVRRA